MARNLLLAGFKSLKRWLPVASSHPFFMDFPRSSNINPPALGENHSVTKLSMLMWVMGPMGHPLAPKVSSKVSPSARTGGTEVYSQEMIDEAEPTPCLYPNIRNNAAATATATATASTRPNSGYDSDDNNHDSNYNDSNDNDRYYYKVPVRSTYFQRPSVSGNETAGHNIV